MPRAAIATNLVDLILDPREIAIKLAHIAADPDGAVVRIRAESPPDVSQSQLDRAGSCVACRFCGSLCRRLVQHL